MCLSIVFVRFFFSTSGCCRCLLQIFFFLLLNFFSPENEIISFGSSNSLSVCALLMFFFVKYHYSIFCCCWFFFLFFFVYCLLQYLPMFFCYVSALSLVVFSLVYLIFWLFRKAPNSCANFTFARHLSTTSKHCHSADHHTLELRVFFVLSLGPYVVKLVSRSLVFETIFPYMYALLVSNLGFFL